MNHNQPQKLPHTENEETKATLREAEEEEDESASPAMEQTRPFAWKSHANE